LKVLALTHFDRLGAASRIRFFQFVPYLKNLGIDITISPLLEDEYLRRLYSSQKREWNYILPGYLKRLCVLTKCSKFDLVWIEKELFKFFPASFERILSSLNKPYIVDYDDATFHNYDLSPSPFFKIFMRNKIDVVMRNSKCVVAGNDYLAQRAVSSGAKRVEILPSVVDLEKYPLQPPDENTIFTIGWIGSLSTTKYLYTIQEALTVVCKTGSVRLMGIGCGPIKLISVPLTFRPWSEETEAKNINLFQVGIMPLTDNPWERGKCGFKLIQYMASRKPVIASPVGINSKIVRHGVNGFLASTTEEWITAINTLRNNPLLAKEMGLKGRECVEREYSVQAVVGRLAGIMSDCAGVS
jgi:glycosyltransferase involved in cell wall biosynthesis